MASSSRPAAARRPFAASVGPGSAGTGPLVSPAPASPARTAACRPSLVLPAGRVLLLARSGRPVSPAHPGRGGVKGGPKAQRALMSAQRPLTPERGRGGSPSSRQTAGAGGCRVPPASAAGRPFRAGKLGRSATALPTASQRADNAAATGSIHKGGIGGWGGLGGHRPHRPATAGGLWSALLVSGNPARGQGGGHVGRGQQGRGAAVLPGGHQRQKPGCPG